MLTLPLDSQRTILRWNADDDGATLHDVNGHDLLAEVALRAEETRHLLLPDLSHDLAVTQTDDAHVVLAQITDVISASVRVGVELQLATDPERRHLLAALAPLIDEAAVRIFADDRTNFGECTIGERKHPFRRRMFGSQIGVDLPCTTALARTVTREATTADRRVHDATHSLEAKSVRCLTARIFVQDGDLTTVETLDDHLTTVERSADASDRHLLTDRRRELKVERTRGRAVDLSPLGGEPRISVERRRVPFDRSSRLGKRRELSW